MLMNEQEKAMFFFIRRYASVLGIQPAGINDFAATIMRMLYSKKIELEELYEDDDMI